jgi:hypothetical protein
MPANPRIDCRRCRQFYVTWDNDFPNGCRLFGFKSRTYPSQTVWEATGAPCEHFVLKEKGAEEKTKP